MTSTTNTFINKLTNISIIKESNNYQPITVRSHLGEIVKPGVVAVGYDLTELVIEEVEEMKNYPEVILVRRLINKEARANRIFKLKRLEA